PRHDSAGPPGTASRPPAPRSPTPPATPATTPPPSPASPAEIRAPAGTLAGVSGFQVHFSSRDIHTPGDSLNALVAMNPAALKTHLKDLQARGSLLVNADAFTTGDLHKPTDKSKPLDATSLQGH